MYIKRCLQPYEDSANLELSDFEQTFFSEISQSKLVNLLSFLQNTKHYVLIIYPHSDGCGGPGIKMTHFTSEDILKEVEKTKLAFGAQVYYCF